MQILNSVKELQRELTKSANDKEHQQAIAEQGLTEEGTFPQFAKFVVFGVLACLNVRLFVVTIGGIWGAVVAGAAVMSACFAVYCWNRVDKSRGLHLRVMQLGAAGFTIIEGIHATASVWELTAGLDGTTKAWAFWYSHKIAFPLMALSIIVGYALHRYTFWTAEINRKRAESQITIARERADLQTRKAQMDMEYDLALANLEHLRRMKALEAETSSEVAAVSGSNSQPDKWPSELRPKP
jgi:hypothetical protein